MKKTKGKKTAGRKRSSRRPLRVLLLRTSTPGVAYWPPNEPFKIPDCQVLPPLGILYLAALIRRELGPAVEVLVESLSTAVRSERAIGTWLKELRPDVVGLSSMSIEADLAAGVAAQARQARPDCFIMIGGPYPTFQAGSCLKRTGADAAVCGEAEAIILPVIKRLLEGRDLQGIPGVALPDGEGHVVSPPPPPVSPLDPLPFPAWDLVPLEAYSGMYNMNGLPLLKTPYAPLITSRGCPHRCSFCHNMFGRKFRARTPENVLDEMELLHDTYGVGEFHVVDDIFNHDAGRMEEICRGIIRRGLKISITFPNGIRGDTFTHDQLDLLREAGCYCMCLSLESASPRILKLMRKKLNLARLAENARYASSIGIITKCIFMVGYPSETREEMEETLRWVRDSDFDLLQHTIACPLPGTEMARQAAAFNPDYNASDWETMNYNVVRNLTTMENEEMRLLLTNGVEEILSEPRRRKRLREIRAMWGPEMERYFDWTLDGGGGGRDARGRRSDSVPTKDLEALVPGILSAHEALKGWTVTDIKDSVVLFKGPGGERVGILVTRRDDGKERMGFSGRFNLTYLAEQSRGADAGRILDALILAFQKVDPTDG